MVGLERERVLELGGLSVDNPFGARRPALAQVRGDDRLQVVHVEGEEVRRVAHARAYEDLMAELLATDHVELDALGRGLLEVFDLGDAAEALSRLDLVWARLAVHIRAEHLHLFPALHAASEAGGPSSTEVEETLSRLRDDHNFFMRELAACVDSLKRQAAGEGSCSPEDLEAVRRKVLGVFERLVEHNRLEEEEVYTWPLTLLAGAERDRLYAGVRSELENLPPRFAAAHPDD